MKSEDKAALAYCITSSVMIVCITAYAIVKVIYF